MTCSNEDLANVHRSVLIDEYTRREFAKFTESGCRIIGACFGVICMYTNIYYYNRSVILWNPSVRRKLTVPDYPCRHSRVLFGFGFDPITDDYKIVGLCAHTSFVYSFKTNSWSEIRVSTIRLSFDCLSYGCFADGSVHWVVRYEINRIAHYYILTFNLISTHVFGMISLPSPDRVNNRLTINQDSNLAVIRSDIYGTWVWIIREDKDNVASWSNASKFRSLEVENSQGYNPFTGVHYALEVDSNYLYRIYMDICGETLELLNKETC